MMPFDKFIGKESHHGGGKLYREYRPRMGGCKGRGKADRTEMIHFGLFL
jgi:hypothetical protein